MAKLQLYVEPASMDLAWNEPFENIRRMDELIEGRLAAAPAVPSEARLFVFPELALTGFVTENPPAFKLEGDPVVERLRRLASERRTALAVGLPERNPASPGRPFNTLLLLGPDGRTVASYRKLHLFTWGAAPESSRYSAGDKAVVASYLGWKIGFSICFDLRFGGLYHQYAKAGADLILAPACWVGGPHKSYQFRTLGSAHAILSQAYVAAVNRSGRDPAYEYDGAGFVFSPFGENVYEGSPCPLDPVELEACRRLAVRGSDRSAYEVQEALP